MRTAAVLPVHVVERVEVEVEWLYWKCGSAGRHAATFAPLNRPIDAFG